MGCRFVISLILFLTIAIQADAQNVLDMLCNMPDTLMPYLSADARKTLAGNAVVDISSGVNGKTVFDSDVKLEVLSCNRLRLAVDSTVVVEMMMLPASGNDSLCCVIRTLQIPQHDSDITLFDNQWHEISTVDFKGDDLSSTCPSFTQKPDTMSQSRFDELLSGMAFLAIEAKSISDTEMLLIPSAPLLFKEDEEPVKGILMQKKVKWDGKIFK